MMSPLFRSRLCSRRAFSPARKTTGLTRRATPPAPRRLLSCTGLWRLSLTRSPQTAGSKMTAANGVTTRTEGRSKAGSPTTRNGTGWTRPPVRCSPAAGSRLMASGTTSTQTALWRSAPKWTATKLAQMAREDN